MKRILLLAIVPALLCTEGLVAEAAQAPAKQAAKPPVSKTDRQLMIYTAGMAHFTALKLTEALCSGDKDEKDHWEEFANIWDKKLYELARWEAMQSPEGIAARQAADKAEADALAHPNDPALDQKQRDLSRNYLDTVEAQTKKIKNQALDEAAAPKQDAACPGPGTVPSPATPDTNAALQPPADTVSDAEKKAHAQTLAAAKKSRDLYKKMSVVFCGHDLDSMKAALEAAEAAEMELKQAATDEALLDPEVQGSDPVERLRTIQDKATKISDAARLESETSLVPASCPGPGTNKVPAPNDPVDISYKFLDTMDPSEWANILRNTRLRVRIETLTGQGGCGDVDASAANRSATHLPEIPYLIEMNDERLRRVLLRPEIMGKLMEHLTDCLDTHATVGLSFPNPDRGNGDAVSPIGNNPIQNNQGNRNQNGNNNGNNNRNGQPQIPAPGQPTVQFPQKNIPPP